MEGNGTSFGELLLAELKLDPCQWEERPSVELRRQELADQCLEIHCLVGAGLSTIVSIVACRIAPISMIVRTVMGAVWSRSQNSILIATR